MGTSKGCARFDASAVKRSLWGRLCERKAQPRLFEQPFRLQSPRVASMVVAGVGGSKSS